MGKNRVLLPNGKFADYVPSKPKPADAPADPAATNENDKESISGGNPSTESTKKIALKGDETVAELKAILDQHGIQYAKNAGKEKCLELLAPHLEIEENGL